MSCPICNAYHEANECAVFQTAAQNLKDLAAEAYQRLRFLVRDGRTFDAVYDHLYASDKGTWFRWSSSKVGCSVEEVQSLLKDRVYMNVRGEHLMQVWNTLQPDFIQNDWEVFQAKRCAPHEASSRRDTIVVYTRNRAASWRLLDRLRLMFASGRLSRDHFKDETPPGTGKVADLPGIATAAQPHGTESYGEMICSAVATVWDKKHQTVPEYTFVAMVLRLLMDKGMDPKRPWNQLAAV